MEATNGYHENNVPRGQINLNTVLGALGTAGATGILGNLFNGNVGANGNGEHYVTRYEADMQKRIAELESEVKLRDANVYTLGEMNKLREYVDNKFAGVEAQICQQNVYNATNTAALNCLQGQIAQLMSLTKLVVPNTSICPGWGNVTITPATTPTTTG